MAHKVHPKSFRIRGMEDWNIRGFYGKKPGKAFEDDYLIKKYLKDILKEASVANVEIEHSSNKMNVIISTSRPGLIIGRGGEGIEKLKAQIIQKINKRKSVLKKELKLEIREIKNPFMSAELVGQQMAQQIEKRIPFRQVLKRTIEKVMSSKEAQGVRLEISGRLNGVEISRREWLKEGRLPRNTIRADIDYAGVSAFCTYGTIGIKVWIYKGEKFE
ncbi:30S ribosomal protein S3 [Patescibacteria group bacterium]|nr:30S ribosomal protein S3 [Patescibacteria group bacterium]